MGPTSYSWTPPCPHQRCEGHSGLLAFLPEEISPRECWSPPHPWTLPQGPHFPLRSHSASPAQRALGSSAVHFCSIDIPEPHIKSCIKMTAWPSLVEDGKKENLRGRGVRTGYSFVNWHHGGGMSGPSSGPFPSHPIRSGSLPGPPTPTTQKDHPLQEQSFNSRVLVYLQESTAPAGGPIVLCSPLPSDRSAHSVLVQAGGRGVPSFY